MQILSPEEREVAISQMEIRRFKPGEALFSEGDMPDGVFYIRRGSAAARVAARLGNSLKLRVIQRREESAELERNSSRSSRKAHRWPSYA